MVILGSTGSIGRNSLEIAERYNLDIETLVAGNNVTLLNKQIQRFSPKIVVVGKKELASKVNHKNVLWGESGILQALEESKSQTVVNALVGFTGLKPTLKTLELGKKLALANKESLVVAGAFLDVSKIHPIDSEHFALWYLLNGRKVERMTLTASGGALRDWDISKINLAKPEDVLKHPNWNMGNKITVDSATMVNKIFEVLEAKWLFGIDKIDGIIETSSTIHSFVEFIDGSTTAHLSGTDMKLPIAFALLDKVEERVLPPVDLMKMQNLEFREIEYNRYPIWLLKNHLLQNPKKGLIINSANDFYVNKFLNKEISFGQISKGIMNTFEKFDKFEPNSIDEVFEIDSEIKKWLKNQN